MQNEYTVFDIANWFLHQSEMTPKKLQKMCYYAYSWGLVFFNESAENINNRLFNDSIEAWVHGPVSPTLYNKYSEYGYRNIEKLEKLDVEFDSDVENLLQQIYDVYGGYDGNELESITHQEAPWNTARKGYGPLDRCNVKLNDSEIFNYYGSRTA